jgi:exodeoxyribonuclease V alpha subunit
VDQLNAIRSVYDAMRTKPGLDVVWDVAVLVPRNDTPAVGRKQLNDYLRELLNPPRANDLQSGQDTWRLRDKVICLKNSEHTAEVFNGFADIARCSSWNAVSDDQGEERKVFVANGEIGRVVATDPEKADCILRFDEPTRHIRVRALKRTVHDDGSDSAREEGFALGYAMTVHKSQGSEWRYVIVVADPGGDRVAGREWWYTAISRGKDACLVVGVEETVRRQIRRAELPGRKTLLVELIQKEMANVAL